MAKFKKYFLPLLLVGVFAVSDTKAQVLPSPDIYISSDQLEQSDTLLVVVKNESDTPSGNLGNVKLHFFRSENGRDQIALVGIGSNKAPGIYQLSVSLPGAADFQRNITVAKRDYPKTILGITPDLSQKGFTTKKIINNLKSENQDLTRAISFFTKKVFSPKPFAYPLSEMKITGEFGDIRSGVQHLGTDFKAPMNTPVYAINDGVVVLERKYTNYGNTLVINHGFGVYSLYLHLSSFAVGPGQSVRQGEVIAFSGSTGYSTGPHLHLSLKVRGANVDPQRFIETTQKYNQ